jgi:hypothetical protein
MKKYLLFLPLLSLLACGPTADTETEPITEETTASNDDDFVWSTESFATSVWFVIRYQVSIN